MEHRHAFTYRHPLVHGAEVIQHTELLCLGSHFHQSRIHQAALAIAEVAHGIGGTTVEKVAEGGQRVTEARVGFGDDGAKGFEHLGSFLEGLVDVRIHVHVAQIGTHGDAQPLHGLMQLLDVIDVATGGCQAIAGIRFGHHVHHQRRICHGAGHGASMGQSAEGAGRPVGHLAEGGLVADNAAETGGNTDGAAGIGTQRQRRHARGNRGRATATTATGSLARVPGVVGGAAERAVGDPFPAKFRRGGFAQWDITVTLQCGNGGGALVEGGFRINGPGAFDGGPHGREEHILDRHRDTIQQPFRFTVLIALFGLPGPVQCGVTVNQAPGIERLVMLFNMVQQAGADFHRRQGSGLVSGFECLGTHGQ